MYPAVREKLRNEIDDCGGCEVLLAARLDEEGMISEIEIAARGDETKVPALEPFLERGDMVVHNHPSGVLKPSKADLGIAAQLGNQGIGFCIIDNNADNMYVVAEPLIVKKTESVDTFPLLRMLQPGGRLSSMVQDFESRPSQVEMLEAVAESFNENRICIAEAGTGVGKSFAYLIPAMAWAIENEERVLVSTATINLQQQLIENDIPTVQRMFPEKVKTVLVKGRGNYLCLNRLEEALEEDSLFQEEDSPLKQIAEWAKTTRDGSRSDLSFFPENSLWSRICSEADVCSGLRCTRRDKCFVIRARRDAAAAKILVSNHHLLFSDLSLRLNGIGFNTTAVLPPFHRLIFDEAHNIEKSASSYFSRRLNKFSVYKYLFRLQRKKGNSNRGLLTVIERILGEKDRIRSIRKKIRPVKERIDVLDNHVLAYLDSVMSFRFCESSDEETVKEILRETAEFQFSLLELLHELGECFSKIPDDDLDSPPVYEFQLIIGRLQEIAGICEHFKTYGEYPDDVFWLEKSRSSSGEPFVSFIITPLDISGVMRRAVYERYDTIVFSSATMTVNNSFTFFKDRIGLTGLTDIDIEEHCFSSPFPYRSNVLLAITTDAPQPNEDGYILFLQDFISKLLTLSEGHGLVLFTAYGMLSRVYDEVQPCLRERGISVYRQGEDERSRLLKKFKTNPSSVLFATNSFWEGVDTPGEALQVVIICRLPFTVPTDPVLNARMERIRKRNGNPFMELSLPEAVMRFRQGFGRLMRRTSDRGVVVISDPRVVQKQYGRIFLASLPETQRSIGESKKLLRDIEDFLY